MTAICLYFQVHQPYRLRHFSFLEPPTLPQDYTDEALNERIVRRVGQRCYLPNNQLLLRLVKQYGERFRIAFSISGTAMEQFEQYAPEVLQSFQKLVDTGNVELLAETSHHSLSFLFNTEEFTTQIQLHREKTQKLFNVTPCIFRNTELIYRDDLPEALAPFRFRGILCEGADQWLQGKSPNFVYQSKRSPRIPLLLRNYLLSDDIAFRFSDTSWNEYPLTAKAFSQKLNAQESAEVINLFMDYETFGEHQAASTGIFNFLEELPEEVLQSSKYQFCTPSDVLNRLAPLRVYEVPRATSWADEARDVSAWLGNTMQRESIERLYQKWHKVMHKRVPHLTEVWRKLQTSDHFYYMATKALADGDVHQYFSPFETPYDAYIAYQNVLQHFDHYLSQYGFEKN